MRDSDILNIIYASSDNSTLAQSITINKIIEVITKNEIVKSFMQSILQYNPKEVIEEWA